MNKWMGRWRRRRGQSFLYSEGIPIYYSLGYNLVWSASGIIDDSIILATTEVSVFNLNFQSVYYVIQPLGHECNAMHRIHSPPSTRPTTPHTGPRVQLRRQQLQEQPSPCLISGRAGPPCFEVRGARCEVTCMHV